MPVRTAVVGYGLAGSVFHAPLIAATDGMEVAAVVTAHPQRAADARSRHPGAEIIGSVDALLSEPGRWDLVVVASPNSSHVPVGLAAIEAGLPVVIDKPVARTAAQAIELRDAAAAKGVMISVYHNRRWDSDALTLAKLVRDGALGSVHRFESRYERWRPAIKEGVWRESPDPDEVGGLLYDLGSHLVDQALTLFGPARSVYAEVDAVRPGARVDDEVFLALTHDGGTRAHLWASSTAADLGPRFRVLGTSAAYVKHGMDGQEEGLKSGTTPGGPGWGEEPRSAWGRLGAADAFEPVPSVPGAYQEYYRGIRDAVRGDGPPPVTIDEAIDVITVIEAARRSADTGTIIPIERTRP